MMPSEMSPDRKKKIKTLLSMMSKQNERIFVIVPPLVEMMDLVIDDAELDYLLQMGTGLFDYHQARKASDMPDDKFKSFFDTMRRKGLIRIELDKNGNEEYRLNAIAVGWYEAMMHYIVGKPQEKAFSEKWNEFFQYFQRFNFSPLREAQNLLMRKFLKPNQGSAILNPEMAGMTKSKTIPINTTLTGSGAQVYPTFRVNTLIEDYGDQESIYAFPCVCRRGNKLIDSSCDYDLPEVSCITFGVEANAWAKWGYGRHVSKAEAIEILKEVRNKGAVHSVIHEKDNTSLPVTAICNCCWDCCAILKPYNMGAVPLKYNASYTAKVKDDADCKGCGNCEKFCPTAAMKLKDERVSLNSDRCIGCGQCAFQCRQNNIELYPNERTVFLPILKKSEARVVAP